MSIFSLSTSLLNVYALMFMMFIFTFHRNINICEIYQSGQFFCQLTILICGFNLCLFLWSFFFNEGFVIFFSYKKYEGFE